MLRPNMKQHDGAAMTFDLLRLDLPNCAAIVALALVPLVSAASYWPQPTEPAAVSTSYEPETTLAQAAIGQAGPMAELPIFE
jgi:hypothetical protein